MAYALPPAPRSAHSELGRFSDQGFVRWKGRDHGIPIQMRVYRRVTSPMRIALVAVMLFTISGASMVPAVNAAKPGKLDFSAATGGYTVAFNKSSGIITVTPSSGTGALAVTELSGDKRLNLLNSVSSVTHYGDTYVLSGTSSWAHFVIHLSLPEATPGELHLVLALTLRKDPPAVFTLPDVQLQHAPASSLKVWAPAPPVAGNSLFLSSAALGSSMLYLANLSALGPYFDATGSGGDQSNFTYPRAGTEGALVGAQGALFGYELPPVSLGNLPRGTMVTAIDSYLYLVPTVPGTEAAMSATYLKMLGTVYADLPSIVLPAANWQALAAKSAADLMDPANIDTLHGMRYLKSYVSDTRTAPELITQAGVLAGVLAYEARYHVRVPLDAMLEANLSSFYDPDYHTVRNGLVQGHDPTAREESWYYIQNLISLLQATKSGSVQAKKLLLDSVDAAITLAHANKYEFPQDFAFTDMNGAGSGTQPDVAGGYAWLMLGLYDLTGEPRYLDEAKASIAHVAGKGFSLTYETQMTAYTAAAAQRLYVLTHDRAYYNDALLALANLFHTTRLWDCTYGLCKKGAGYHTLFGVNILPWGDYIAMLEQYETWLGLRDYRMYAQGETPYILALVNGLLTATPSILQYSLPPALPAGAVPAHPGSYGFVSKNRLDWDIPVEDLREGEAQSGVIGQEIYGAGGTFMLAAYAP
jgi:hypothetical protein